ncbi:SIMPL domain-containing protein [Acidithiobacillus ferridurans]|uniref:SIMPL domain-containing protein n=1 Tax=Acidithiobacillus ferridurans TaxID=1232575 RepID=A0A8X8KBK1_ACIFI|nr:SIMPL domain-containing protein [Acidithiobacillus ferridurans]MBU2714587.1 SIMPL domain-containing protein [Acidithiobacillus ferridurans]MBU2724791.1 SIMPL domain-containing protein [Acidithiobacillus ferridurans]MBU2725855.1 SIMPL domain-containing protein [Acidithiobacillus ferridurans]
MHANRPPYRSKHFAVSIVAGLISFIPAVSLAATCKAADAPYPPTSIHLSASADYRVADSELTATLSAQDEGPDPASLAARVNQTMAWAAKILPEVQGLHWHTSGYATTRTGVKTAPWRVQESLVVRSADPQALLPLLGTLQSRMQLEGIDFTPAPGELRKVQNHASTIALQRFRSDAIRYCKAMGFTKPPLLGEINIQTGQPPVSVRPFPVMMAARALPGPVTARPGEFRGRVTADGTAYCQAKAE